MPRKATSPAALKRLQRPNLVEEVTRQLRAHIMDGTYAAEQALPSEGNMAASMGVSRTVIREAMCHLRNLGLVEVSQGRRPRVKAPDNRNAIDGLELCLQRTGASIDDLTEVRRTLEMAIVVKAAKAASAESIAAMEACNQAVRDAANLEQQVTADLAFHQALADATGNPVYGLLLESLSEMLTAMRSRVLANVGIEKALQQHQAIADAVASGNPEAARTAMDKHLDHAEKDIY